MKRALLLLTGFLLQLAAPYAYAEPLYDTVKKNIEEELQSKDVEETVAKFIAAIAKEKEWGITDKEVKDVVEGDTGVCSKHETLNGLGCFPILDEIKTAVAYENDVRLAGRRLQSIATSYELPVSEIPGRASTIMGDLNGIVNIWKAGTGSFTAQSSGTIPSVTIEDKETMQSLLQNLADSLEDLDEEERVAAVWKYQYGKRLIKGERAPSFAAPAIDTKECEKSERRFLCKRWEEVENALDAVWTELRLRYGTDPELPVFYLAFPEDLMEELPDGIIVWARMDKDPEHPAGDVGLQWKYAFQPVLPALVDENDKPILGGNYPPAPKENETVSRNPSAPAADEKTEGSGLCSMSFALRGYLCRPVVQTSAVGCPAPEDGDKDAITLVGCAFQNLQNRTIAGPDVCSQIAWNSAKKQNSSAAGGSSSSLNPSCGCTYSVSCQATCGGEGDGSASLKDANGHISVCIGTNPTIPIPRKYVLSHELAHVRQFCGLPPGAEPTATKEGCCSYEHDAHSVECAELEGDGFFSGTSFTVAECAAILANASCSRFGANACAPITKERTDALIKTVTRENAGSCPVPEQGKKVEMNMCPCTPETLSNYGNTVGNNLCFIGQCVEQSLETHRLTGGRTPAGVQDEAYPNDDPLAGSPLGNFLAAPTAGQPILPPYKPLQPVHEFEAALCALVGLPVSSPPALCAIAANRRTDSPLGDPLSTILSMAQLESQQRLTSADMAMLAESVGMRMGTDLYARNLRVMSKTLAEVIGVATKLLNEVKSIEFPTEMCPLGSPSAAR